MRNGINASRAVELLSVRKLRDDIDAGDNGVSPASMWFPSLEM